MKIIGKNNVHVYMKLIRTVFVQTVPTFGAIDES